MVHKNTDDLTDLRWLEQYMVGQVLVDKGNIKVLHPFHYTLDVGLLAQSIFITSKLGMWMNRADRVHGVCALHRRALSVHVHGIRTRWAVVVR